MLRGALSLLVALLAGISPLLAQPYVPGNTYFSPNGHIEYRCGDLPLVIAAPHGGYLQPADMPDRTCNNAVWVTDANTLELTLSIDSAFQDRYGCRPHVIINHLHRRKMDGNRNQADATCGDPQAIEAWNAFHGFINAAKSQITDQFGKGFFVDVHGHGHSVQRLELGYLLYEDELALPDAVLNSAQYINWSSLRHLAGNNLQGLTHVELLRGGQALGTLLGDQDYPGVPSAQDPFPLPGQPYFSGGYNTVQHSSYLGGTIDGVQMECHMTGVRDTAPNRQRFADSLSVVLVEFLHTHYFGNLDFLNCLSTRIDASAGHRGQLRCQPTIATDHVMIELPAAPAMITLIDARGRIVHQEGSTSTRASLNITGLAPGLHAVVARQGTSTWTGRFIKE
jgi:hypothetical protein